MYRMERHRSQYTQTPMGRNRKHKSFAHEIARLHRKMEKQGSDSSSIASGAICMCGLECRLAPDDRVRCEKCHEPYCSVDCLKWAWEKGGHRDECPGQPPRKTLKMLEFQNSDASTVTSAASKSSDGSQRKPSLPFHDIQKKIYNQLQGKPPVGVIKEGDKFGPSAENEEVEAIEEQIDEQFGEQGEEELAEEVALHELHSDGTGSQSQYTEKSASVSGTLESSEYTEVTVEDSKTSEGSKEGQDGAFPNDDDLYCQPAERFLDDIPEEDTEAESSSADQETLEINQYGSFMAAHYAPPYREESATPDTPGGETPITSNNTNSSRRKWREFEKYEGPPLYDSEEKREDAPAASYNATNYNADFVVVPNTKNSDDSDQPERFEDESPVPDRVEVPSKRKGRYHSIPDNVMFREKQRDQHPEKPVQPLPLTKEQIRVLQMRDSGRLPQQRYFDYSRQQVPPMYAPAVPIESSESRLIDEEAPSSGGMGDDEDEYEFMSATRIRRRRQKRIIRFFAVTVSFMIGIMIVAAAVAGILWFKPSLIGFNFGKDEDLDTESPTPAPTQPTVSPAPTLPIFAAEPFEMTLARQFQSTADGYGASVALAGDILAIGSPVEEKVETYFRDGNRWKFADLLGRSDADTGFAADISMSVDDRGVVHLVVGASGSNQVFLYEYSPLSGLWEEVGAPLSVEVGLRRLSDETNDSFGASVSISNIGRVAVGAPANRSNGVNAGITYIFHFADGGAALQSTPESTFAIKGEAADSRSGSSVDISSDGTSVAVGEPGGRRLRIFDWNGEDWIETFHLHLPREFDLGSSVAFLSNDYVAVGSPSARNSKGIVHVCRKTQNGWVKLAELVGDFGDRLGTFGTIGGTGSSNGPELVVATAGGSVRRYDYDGNDWIKVFDVDEGVTASSIAVSKTDNSYEVMVGFAGADSAALYTPVVASSPTTGPQTDPTQQPTVSPSKQAGNTSSDNPTFSTPTPSPQETPSLSPSTALPTTVTDPTPTSSPLNTPTTSSPTEMQGTEWNISPGSPFFGLEASSNYGSSVAVAGYFVVAGEDGAGQGTGQILTYGKDGKDGVWTALDTISEADTLKFGSAVDLVSVNNVAHVLIGAKETKDGNELARFGSASFFTFDEKGASQLGSVIQPPFNLVESGGNFGSAVAMATDIRRIAVAAPESNLDGANLDTGRIYTYEFDGADWQQMAAPEIGSAGSKLGTSLDMSKNGSYMLAGAPHGRNGAGLVYYYKWDPVASEWDEILPIFGSDNEALGSSVAILDDEATLIAFGAPGHGQDNEGLIRVYRDFGIAFYPQGGDIVGLPNEKIGTTLCGSKGRVAFGTATGSFRVYEWKVNQWVELASGPSLGSPVTSISMSENARTVVVGLENHEVRVYDLE